jgi:hypothetical protein
VKAYKIVTKRRNRYYSSNYGLVSYPWMDLKSKKLTKQDITILRCIKKYGLIIEYKEKEPSFPLDKNCPLLAFKTLRDALEMFRTETGGISLLNKLWEIWEVEVDPILSPIEYYRIHPSHFEKFQDKKITFQYLRAIYGDLDFTVGTLFCNSIKLVRKIK